MTATIHQINISPGGIPKRPIAEAVLTRTGILGDSWAHPQFHGGPKQAVLLIALETLEELKASGYPVHPGALGENFTTVGLDRRELRAGQRYRIGETLIQLTKLRTPCNTLNIYDPKIKAELFDARAKAGDAASPVWARGGFYAEVLHPGTVRPHDIISLVDQVV